MKTHGLKYQVRLALLVICSLHSASLLSHAQDKQALPDRRVYVPIDQLDVIAGHDRRGVMLARKDFNELLAKAAQNDQAASDQPDGLIVTSTTYQAKIVGDHLVLDAAIKFTQFTADWQQLLLPFGNISVEKATIGNQAARLGRSTAGRNSKPGGPTQLVLFHDEVGAATLNLKLSTLLESVGNSRAARMTLIPSPTGVLTVDVVAGKHLQLGTRALERPAPNEQPTTYNVPVGGQRNMLLMFNAHQDEQAADTLTFASTGYGLRVAPGEVTWQAATSLQVYGATLNQLFCTVPNTLEITDVESTGLESWDLSDDPADADATLITLNYRQPFSGKRKIVFQGVLSQVSQTWNVPNLTVRNVTSHVGRVVVQHPPGVRVRRINSDGVRVRPGQAGSQSFDLWREDFSLSLETRTKERDIHATIATIADLNQTGVKYFGDIDIQNFFAPLFEVSFLLPNTWIVDSVKINGAGQRWQVTEYEDDDAWNNYRIELKSPLPAGSQLKLAFDSHLKVGAGDAEDEAVDDGVQVKWPIEDEPLTLELPSVKIPDASVVVGTFAIKATPDLALKTGDLDGIDPTVTGISGERLGFSFENTDYLGTLDVRRPASRVTVSTVTFSRLDRVTFHSHLEAKLNIEGGGMRTLDVLVSATAGKDLRFELLDTDVRIVDQQPGTVVVDQRPWTLQLDQRLRGDARLQVNVVAKRKGSDEFAVHQISLPNADRSDGFIAIEGAADQQIEITATDGKKPLSVIDPIDLPATSYRTQQRIVGAFRYNVPGYSILLKEKRFERVAVPTALCHKSTLQTVVGRTGEIQLRVQYNFVAVGAQSLGIVLPSIDQQPASLWAVLIDGSPIEVRSTKNSYLVPIPQTESADAQRELVLYYSNQGQPLADTQKLRQQPPQISVIHSEGGEQPLTILDQNWELYYPDDAVVEVSAGDYSTIRQQDSDSVLGQLQDRFTNLNRDQLSQNVMTACIVLFILGGIAVTIRRTGFGAVGVLASVVTTGVLVSWFVLSQTSTEYASSTNELASDDYTSSTSAGGEEATPGDDGANFDFDVQDSVGSPEEDDERYGAVEAAEASDEMDLSVVDAPAEAPAFEPKPQTPPVGQNLSSDTKVSGRSTPQKKAPAALDRIAPEMKERLVQQGGKKDKQEEAKDGEFWADENGRGEAPEINALKIDLRGGTDKQFQFEGLLSLQMGLEIPDGTRSQSFQYTGSRAAKNLSLEITWQDQQTVNAIRILVLLVVAATLFLLIRKGGKSRIVVSVLAITLPLGLVSIAPVSWHAILDGIFLGAIGALLIWLCRTMCQAFGNSTAGRKIKTLVARTAGDTARRASKSSGTTLLVVSVLLGLPSNLHAADPPAQPAGQKAAIVTQPRVLIPYVPGQDPLLADRVLLTRAQFLTLWNKANPTEQLQQTAPVDGLVADAFFQASLQADAQENQNKGVVSVAATIILYSFVDRQISIPVPVGNVALSSAQLDGKAAPLKLTNVKGRQQLNVVLESKGSHVLDLKFAVPARISGAVGQFTLPVSSVPAGRVVFALPSNGLSVRVNGSTNAYRRVTNNGAESIDIPVGAGKPLTVAWRPPEQKGAVSGIINVENSVSVWVGNEGLAQQARIDIKVPQGSVSELTFEVPDALRIREISGPHMAGWQAAVVDGKRQLKVFFNPPITDATRLDLNLFSEQEFGEQDTKFEVQTVSPQDVTREVGVVGIVSSNEFGVRNGAISNATRLDISQQVAKSLPTFTTSEKLSARLAWRFVSRPFSLECLATRKTPASNATVSHAVRVARRRVHIGTRIQAQLEGSPRSVLSFRLPDEYLLVGVDASSMKEWFVTAADDDNPRTLTIELAKAVLGKIEIVLQGYTVKSAAEFALSVAFPEPLEISTMKSAASVLFDDSYKPKVSNIAGWKQVDARVLPADLRNKPAGPSHFAFVSEALEDNSLEFEISQIAPQLSANAVVITTVGDTFVEYAFYLDWRISGVAVDTFIFEAPQALKDRLKIVVPHPSKVGKYIPAPNVRDVQVEEIEGNRESARWKMTLKKPVKNRYLALAVATVPVKSSGVQSQGIKFVEPIFDEYGDTGEIRPVAPQQLYSILVNPSIYQLDEQKNNSVESITADRLPIALPQGFVDQAVKIARVSNLAQMPSWRVRKLEQQAGAPASVNVADLTLVLAKDGTWRTQAVYTIRNRRRQFLGLKLPADSQLLSVYVNGQPTRPVITALKDQRIHLVALPKSSDADASFAVKVVCGGSLTGKLPGGFSLESQEVDLPAPHVVSQDESSEYGIPVARTLWTVYVPNDIDAAPIDESGKTNLKLVDETKTEVDDVYAKALLQDLSSGNTVMESEETSERQKQFAYRNFSEINEQLSEYAANTSDEKTRQSIRQEQKKYAFNRKRVEELGVPMDGPADSSKTRSQRLLIAGNNRSILRDNSDSMVEIENGDDVTEVEGVVQFKLGLGGRQTRDAKDSQIKGKAGTRAKQHRQSRSNLSTLNSRVEQQNQLFGGLDNLNNAEFDNAPNGNTVSQPQMPKGGDAGDPFGRLGESSPNRVPRAGTRRPTTSTATTPFATKNQTLNIPRFNLEFAQRDVTLVPNAGFSDGTTDSGQAWSHVGGLSLAIEIPKDGSAIRFTKVSGQPKLTLQIRSKQLIDTGLGAVWTIVWIGIGGVLLVGFARVGQPETSSASAIGISLFSAGLACFLVLPNPISSIGFVAFLAGSITFAVRYARNAQPTTTGD